LSKRVGETWVRIINKDEFNLEYLIEFKPDKIFIPHWSFKIPETIYLNYECVLFHMTDLPYGRGGSPLQNLIINGKAETKISAIRVSNGIDTGPIYLKKNLALTGTAEEIFDSSSIIIFQMIDEIISKRPDPIEQKGDVVYFKRRRPEDGDIRFLSNLERIHDYIRMLDCHGYPNAFIETDFVRIEFSNSKINNNEIIANVRIVKK
jgi:methionyl-tRNA formyltransferase